MLVHHPHRSPELMLIRQQVGKVLQTGLALLTLRLGLGRLGLDPPLPERLSALEPGDAGEEVLPLFLENLGLRNSRHSNNQENPIMILLWVGAAHAVNYFYEELDDKHFMLAVPMSQYNRHKRLRKRMHLQELDLYIDPETDSMFDFQSTAEKQEDKYPKNFCYQGLSMEGKSLHEKLEAFKKGPCSPTLLVPGIMGTKLIVSIDCQTLRDKGGQRFLDCGWQTCGIGFGPDKEYLLWVSVSVLLMPISKPAMQRKCFGDLMEMKIVYEGSKISKITNFPGINVTWYGNSESSAKDSKCGLNAVRNLNGATSVLGLQTGQCALDGYSIMSQKLLKMGYETGLTLQAIPYDYRVGINYGNTTKIIPTALCNLHAITGKKALVITHSLGSLHTLSSLGFSMKDADKDKCVRLFLPIGPPWMGVSSAIRNTLIGDANYFSPNENDYFSTGINQFQQERFVRTSGGAIDLFLRDSFNVLKGEPWLDEVAGRIAWDEGKATAASLKWFPPPSDDCYDHDFYKHPKCSMYLVDFTKQHIFDIMGQKYFANPGNYSAMFKKWAGQQTEYQPVTDGQVVMDIFNIENTPGRSLAELPEPGVPVTVIFTSYYDTELIYKMDVNISKYVDNNTFAPQAEVKYVQGDLSVPTYAVLMPISRWISKGNKGKAVKAVQFCANRGKFGQHYDSITCQCVQNQFQNQITCSHACMISDKHVISYALDALTNEGKGFQEDTSAALALTENDLQDIAGNCLNLGPVDIRKKYAVRGSATSSRRHFYLKGVMKGGKNQGL